MERTVTVTGQGTSYAVPDAAVVNASVGHRAASVTQALEGANSAAAKAIRVASEHVDADRVATQSFNVWPQHDHQGRQDGFECRHSMSVRCPSLEVAGAVIDALAHAVGNRLQVEGVSLLVTDQAEALRLATEAAYAEATVKAAHLAGLAGATLGPALTVTEGGSFQPHPRVAMAASAKMDTAFAPGESALSASVTVTFALT
jgi:uncharacterized protein